MFKDNKWKLSVLIKCFNKNYLQIKKLKHNKLYVTSFLICLYLRKQIIMYWYEMQKKIKILI